MERLDELLERIEAEPISPKWSGNEREFWEKMRELRRQNKDEYIKYVFAYNRIKNLKYDDL